MTTPVRPLTRRPLARRRLALMGVLAALAVPTLSACNSFDYASDRQNVIADGGWDLDSTVRINAARIVSGQEGSGVFIATFTLNPTIDAATSGAKAPTFTGLEASSKATETVQAASFTAIPVGNQGVVNLADPSVGGVAVTGDFQPGDSIPLTLTFSEGDPVTLHVPVVAECGVYADVVAQDAAGTSADNAAQSSDTAEGGDDSTGGLYSCDYPAASLPAE
ncbi:MAG: hypothetical protein QM638_13240 [Nocardioides sp.]|uniref:hypothetical protein n=1 Tax=Nocardioides sp. TaxID=35761 RepID=UPI0039E71C53